MNIFVMFFRVFLFEIIWISIFFKFIRLFLYLNIIIVIIIFVIKFFFSGIFTRSHVAYLWILNFPQFLTIYLLYILYCKRNFAWFFFLFIFNHNNFRYILNFFFLFIFNNYNFRYILNFFFLFIFNNHNLI